MHNKILVIGLDQVALKSLQLYTDLASFLSVPSIAIRSRDFACRSHDTLNAFNQSTSQINISRSCQNPLSEILHLLFNEDVASEKALVHLYLAERNLTLFAQVMILILLNRKYDVICRGGELYRYSTHHPLRKILIRLALKFSTRIFYRELYAEKYLIMWNLLGKSKHVHNAVSDSTVSAVPKSISGPIHLLFLNSFKEWRHPIIALKATHILLLKGYDVKLKIVGNDPTMPSRLQISHELQLYIDTHCLADKVSLEDWTYTPQEFFDWAHFFLLPAELVYLNISLIEGMASGCIPLTSNVDPDTKRIFGDYDNLLTCPPSPQDFADTIVNILSNPSTYTNLSRVSIEIIRSKFLRSSQLLKLTSNI